MIDVQVGSLGALEQYLVAPLDRLVERDRHIGHMRRQAVGVAAVGIDDFLRIERGGGEVILEIEIFFVQ